MSGAYLKHLKIPWPSAVNLYRWILIGGFMMMLAFNLPGQLSYDSIVQLYDGRFHVRTTWAPAVYSALLGGFDSIVPGTSLYLVASGTLIFGALLALRLLRPALSWAAPAVALGVVLTPTLMLFQGTVWKDIFFANLVVAAFVLLAWIAARWPADGPVSWRTAPWPVLLLLLLLLALAAQVRQNGLIAAGMAALVLAWTVRGVGWRKAAGWGLGGLAAVILVSQILGALALPAGVKKDDGYKRGMTFLQSYDLAGLLARDKTLPLAALHASSPQIEALMRRKAPSLYSPERIDYLMQDDQFGAIYKHLPSKPISKDWRHLVLSHPKTYLLNRLDAFRWVLMTPKIEQCLPVYVGVDGPAERMKALNISEGVTPPAQALYDYGERFVHTPLYSHLGFALAALAAAGFMLKRREAQDVAMAGLMISALGFTASFLLISVACDYRYLYLLDLAALTGWLYLVIDFPLRLFPARPWWS